jgi:hypothetical protein
MRIYIHFQIMVVPLLSVANRGGDSLNRQDAKAGTPGRKENIEKLGVLCVFAVNFPFSRTINTLQGDHPFLSTASTGTAIIHCR